jgi:hypothetical protein
MEVAAHMSTQQRFAKLFPSLFPSLFHVRLLPEEELASNRSTAIRIARLVSSVASCDADIASTCNQSAKIETRKANEKRN